MIEAAAPKEKEVSVAKNPGDFSNFP